MADVPVGEAMSREGKGTDSESEEGRSRPLSWPDVERRLAKGGWFWLATVRPDGAPHVMPLFAAWAGTSFFIASKDRARKSRNLEAEPRCVVITDTGDLHVIVEGIAEHVRDGAALQRAVSAFDAVYSWPTRVDGGHLDADYGAPTSGGPPYEVYEVTPAKAFALPTDGETTTPTRWVWPAERNRRAVQISTSPSPAAVAEAFSRHQFSEAYPYLADHVRWALVGGRTMLGKDAAVAACEDTLSQLTETTTRFRKFKIIARGGSVVIDSIAEYQTPGQPRSVVASCDIYEFSDGLVSEITSYTVELPDT